MANNEPLHHDDAPIAPRNPRTALIAYSAPARPEQAEVNIHVPLARKA